MREMSLEPENGAVPCAAADAARPGAQWVTCWTASAQGPYPCGNPAAQPDLSRIFPAPEHGAQNQSFRLILRPDLSGARLRLRFSNAFGTRPLVLDGVYVGRQLSGSALVSASNRPVRFAGVSEVSIAPGASLWSDALSISGGEQSPALAACKLAVSFHVVGTSGPMTWHAKALTTSYLTRPHAGAHGHDESESAFPASTTSWFFLDAVDMAMPAGTRAIVALGDSLTDGTGSTLNGDDRWPDVMARRVHAMFGQQFSVINAGIGGNQVRGPRAYSVASPFAGGPSALSRLQRDVVSLSNVGAVIWLEGINDFSDHGQASVAELVTGMQDGVARLRSGIPGVRIIGATLGSVLGSSNPAYGRRDQDERRKAFNTFVRTSRLFDAFVDFDRVLSDPQTLGLRAEFVPDSTCGGSGDGLHPNRFGYQAMGAEPDLATLLAKPSFSNQ